MLAFIEVLKLFIHKKRKIFIEQFNELFREVLIDNIDIKEAVHFSHERLVAILKLIEQEKKFTLDNPTKIYEMIEKTKTIK